MALSHDLCYSIVDIRHLLEYHDSFSSVLRYFNFVLSVVICLVGLVGNAVVICFVRFIMKKHKSKYWFLNLAIADFFSLLILPFQALSAFKGTWIFGPHMCKLFIFSICVNMYSSIYILMALNIAKVLSVTQPMFHLKFISQHVSVRICTLIWFLTILLSLPVFYYAAELHIGEITLCSYLGSKTFVDNRYNVSSTNATRDLLVSEINAKLKLYFEQCSSDTCCGGEETFHFWNHLMFSSKQFVIPLLIIGYFIPLGVMIVCNITIVAHVRKSKTVNTHRLYQVVLIIIMVYFITWTPLVVAEIAFFIAALNMNLIVMFHVLAFMPLMINIAYANSCLNPIVYVLTGGRVRTGISDCISSFRSSVVTHE